MKKAVLFPIVVSQGGVSARIRKIEKTKKDQQYTSYVVDYVLLGRRKQEWRSDLQEAKRAALEACRRIANGEQLVLQLSNHDRLVYVRAIDSLKVLGLELDVAAAQFAQATAILNGAGTVVDAAEDFVRRRAVVLPKISVLDAVRMFKQQATDDGKSAKRLKDLSAVLDRFAKAFSVDVDTLAPRLISDYLSALPFKERTKRNHRDVIGYFNRWLVLREYLGKGTDLLDGVQNYSARKIGEITTFTPEEMSLLVQKANPRLLPFIVIAGFAGLRHAEITRLDWSDIDLAEGFIEIAAHKSKTDTRRIVPIKDNLRAWLSPLAKASGPVIEIVNISAAVQRLARSAGIKWKHNALRHTYISARVAECADIPRVADEAGNSPQIIRTNYLKRLRPSSAAAWFSIMPGCHVPTTIAPALELRAA